MIQVDLTPFGFTPTEGLVYGTLLTHGPGTGYALARAAGLARANAYSALAGLVAKGAAQVEAGRPKRYRAEPPPVLVARLSSQQNRAIDGLAASLEALRGPESPTLVEIGSPRAAIRQISHDVARAKDSVRLVAPADAYPLLGPVLRRAAHAGLEMHLRSVGSAERLSFADVPPIAKGHRWPGMPLLSVVDDQTALVAARQGNSVQGYWGQGPAFVASARLSIERLSQDS